ncbi:MAG: hypothetical protein HY928_02200 [Elusimicrobia bacterium]|nr:hypothetical protein [Elusimicrobiota bacterium]
MSSAPAQEEVEPFDAANYPKALIAEQLKKEPCAKRGGPYELKDLRFAAEVRWQGALRPGPAANIELMKRWTREIGDPEAAAKYAEEATVVEGPRPSWVSVPEGLLAYLQMDLMAGDRVLLYLVHVGCAAGAPVLAVDEYEVLDQTELEGADELIYAPSPGAGRYLL